MRQWCPGQDDPGHVSTGKPIGFTNQLIGSIMVLPAAGKQVVASWTRGKSMMDGQQHFDSGEARSSCEGEHKAEDQARLV